MELFSIASGSSGNCICVGNERNHVMIDVGISGITAERVGNMMKHLGASRQIISITHLPQIACVADTAYVIEKEVRDDKTMTGIRKLDEEGRVLELARLLGGANVTDAVIESAREMINRNVD